MIVLLSLFSLAAVERRDAANWHEKPTGRTGISIFRGRCHRECTTWGSYDAASTLFKTHSNERIIEKIEQEIEENLFFF